MLADLGVILAIAGLASVIFQRLRQPAVLGYLFAGLLLGPHVLTGITVDVELTHSLSELGVILLMFSIGLEFRLRRLLRVGVPGGLTALIEVGLMVSLGYAAGLAFGFSAIESLFVGGCLGISSTMLVARAFAEQEVRAPFVEVTYAILIFEDILAILLLVLLTAVASGRGLGPTELAGTLGRLFGFLALLLGGGLLVVPRFIRWVAKIARAETLMVVAVALCFVMATMAEAAGYSVALGAFLAGILVAESGESHAVDVVIGPLRDIFAAIFFISVGTFLDPALVLEHWPMVLVLTALVLVGKTGGVTIGSFLAGNGLKRSVRAGMSLAQIGEFAFIIAGLGASSGATGPFLLPVAVAVSCLTALTTPAMIRASERVAEGIDHRLPRPLQTLTSFYEAWIEALRERPPSASEGSAIRRRLLMLGLDAALLVVVIAGHGLLGERLVGVIAATTGLAAASVTWGVIALAAALALFFLIAVLRQAARLGETLAARVLPPVGGEGPDLGRAPRRVFVQVLEVAIALGLGLPLVAILGPFLPFSTGAIALVVILGGLVAAARRSLGNFQGHVRAGTEVVVELLARQVESAPEAPSQSLDAGAILPGFPDLEVVLLVEASPAVGQTLASINLRALTGATVMAIQRAGEGVVLPSAGEVLREGDALALAGAHAAITTARAVLTGIPAAAEPADAASSR
ncbi:MAG: cation:proton antiporter [Myxococcales bacterium]|nr:cation:proton antiporter [Myxococcales bacterium]